MGLYSLLQAYYSLYFQSRWVTQFRDIFDADNYHPIQISSLVEYTDITSSFPHQNAALEAAPFPKQFPFSVEFSNFDYNL